LATLSEIFSGSYLTVALLQFVRYVWRLRGVTPQSVQRSDRL
jgi:hypothetical protein